MAPTPRLTLGSRKWIGSSCAWQSVMCSSETLPKRGRSYRRVCGGRRRRRRAQRARPMPAADAGAEHLQELALRRGSCARRLLVDRRLRVEQQRHQVLHLLSRRAARRGRSAACRSRRCRPWRSRACPRCTRRSAWPPALAGSRHAAQLAVVVQARADGAEGDLVLADLVAVVAVAAVGARSAASVQVMPRPFCASFSPSRQSPRNWPSPGHLTVLRLAASMRLGDVAAASGAVRRRAGVALASSCCRRSTVAMPWSRNEALHHRRRSRWSSSAAVRRARRSRRSSGGGGQRAEDDALESSFMSGSVFSA